MEIQQQHQYNQAISRYKLLSANAGVGSIITTGTGNYVLISDIGQWPFIKASNSVIKDMMADGVTTPENWYEKAKKDIMNIVGVSCVDDERFIQFLKVEKGLAHLLCLAAIPQLSLNENFNSLNKKDNPIIKKLETKGINKEAKDFAIPATHFPKWFRNEKGILKAYHEWKEDWKKAKLDSRFFAPPRDANDRFPYKMKIKQDNNTIEVDACKILTQTNLIFICENGHLSDIPWPKFLRWRTESKRSRSNEKGDTLFTDKDCCEDPKLKWTESKNRSEGYASIYIECTHCGMGNGKKITSPKINLEGINNLEPLCPGHKPWEIPLDENSSIPFEAGCCNKSGQRSAMKVALVTGNNVYFANTFSSIYIPNILLKGISPEIDRLLKICEQKFSALTDPDKSKKDWAERRINAEFLQEYNAKVEDQAISIQQLRTAFIEGINATQYQKGNDLHEVYRKEEYDVFSQNEKYAQDGLTFVDMSLNESLSLYFKKIQKIEELKVTSVQLDFNRVTPSERAIGPDGKVVTSNCKNIFSNIPEDVFTLPAVENYGEGIFFEFNSEALELWITANNELLSLRISSLMPTGGSFNGNALRCRIQRDKAKLLLIHTFSHLIMRELEFSCGYPTSSIKERLYISPEMSGLLIYTADGSEGSMGGLIWQVQPERMTNLIIKAMERALDCSSDPLCWEDEGQGLFNLNLSACFSCALVSETACEERNLALDRRMLVDGNFGYFFPLIQRIGL
jgi:hypothetical protein